MTVFRCHSCGAVLTRDLTRLPAVPPPPVREHWGRGLKAPSTVPAGYFAIEPEPWGFPYEPLSEPDDSRPAQPRGVPLSHDGVDLGSVGPRNTIVIHPQDGLDLRLSPAAARGAGCCGPSGEFGPNLACACGALVATLVAECSGPYELVLEPHRVVEASEEG